MRTTRAQRKQFIKDWIKKNPNITRSELDALKKQMRDLGIAQHNLLREEIHNKYYAKETINSEIHADDVDFAPDDLNEIQ